MTVHAVATVLMLIVGTGLLALAYHFHQEARESMWSYPARRARTARFWMLVLAVWDFGIIWWVSR